MAYHRPTRLEAALEIRASGDVRLLAGGTDIYPATKARDLVEDILDLTDIAGLGGITQGPDGWRIGAGVTWAEVIHADLPPAFDGLKSAARQVGSAQIQARASVVGNICNASPAADGVPPLLTLKAEVDLASRHGVRRLSLAEFLTGLRQTALRGDEIVTAIHIPADAAKGRGAFTKLGARKYLVISIAMVAVRLGLKGGRITQAAVGVGAMGPIACRLPGLEAALLGQPPDRPEAWRAALEGDIAARLAPIDDLRADAAYRRAAVAVLIGQTIAKAAR